MFQQRDVGTNGLDSVFLFFVDVDGGNVDSLYLSEAGCSEPGPEAPSMVFFPSS